MSCPYCGAELVGDGAKRMCFNCGRSFYVCSTCGSVFATQQALASHKRRHRKRNPDTGWQEALLSIEGRLSDLERGLEEVKARLAALEQRVAERESRAGSPRRAEEWLPSFAVDNPWLGVLSGRK